MCSVVPLSKTDTRASSIDYVMILELEVISKVVPLNEKRFFDSIFLTLFQ